MECMVNKMTVNKARGHCKGLVNIGQIYGSCQVIVGSCIYRSNIWVM